MGLGDLQSIGFCFPQGFRVAASATRGYAGEPINNLSAYTSGDADVNTVVVLTDGKPVIGTDAFCGVAGKSMAVNSAGTVTAQDQFIVEVPVANGTRIRGRGKTAASVDTDAEILGLLWDLVLFDLTSAVYTIDEDATADTSGLTIRDGDARRGTLDVVVDARVMRADVAA